MSDSGEQVLHDLLAEAVEEEYIERQLSGMMGNAVASVGSDDTPPTPNKSDKENHCQWAIGGNGKFMPVGATEPRLKAGIYEPFADPGMWGLERMEIASDGIYSLPDMATEAVLKEVQAFWANEERYRAHKLLYKRGLLLWGPPGGGKTVTIKLLMNELVKRDGIVVVANNIGLTIMCLKAIRRIETKRNIILVLEDIDEIIHNAGEAPVLSMLDGESNIDNILHLASTNYPERLGARIINRPSRFDRRVYVGMPGPEARKEYLRKTTNNGLSDHDLKRWVKDTNEMSIAHLRELVAAVYCLEQPYEEVLQRLQDMAVQVKSEEEFKRKGGAMGFKNKMITSALLNSQDAASGN